METSLQLAGSRIEFNQGAPLAGFTTPCVVVWDRSDLILIANDHVIAHDRRFMGPHLTIIVVA